MDATQQTSPSTPQQNSTTKQQDSTMQKTSYDFVKKALRPAWCPGCGLFSMNKTLSDQMSELGWTDKNTVIVSGIGCTGLSSSYYESDGLESDHGRAICMAEGVKIAKPELNVVVFSGDGDLTGIGGNHLIHAARRNTNITVICNVNEVYGMTGGQLSPTTPFSHPTKTSTQGSTVQPINVKSLITGYDHYFYAKTSISDPVHMRDTINAALKWQGFAFVEVLSMCPTNHGRIMGFKTPVDMLKALKEKVDQGAEHYKLEIVYK